MTTYILPFDPTGHTHEEFQVPQNKQAYLVRDPRQAQGTATVQDLLSLDTYTLGDGVTVCRTAIAPGTAVSLAFMARSNQRINSVTVEVISPRPNIPGCVSSATSGDLEIAS